MFLETDRRYFRRYTVRLKPRTKFAPELALVSKSDKFTALDAFQRAIRNRKATVPQPNGDSIDLIGATHIEKDKVVVLLFHRASPDAADPAYRKKERAGLTLRQTKKKAGEEQAVSCHLVISTTKKDGVYPAALEEIPGLSASAIMSIVGQVLRDYKYPYVKKKKELETDTVLKVDGVKSESLERALKRKNALTSLTLVRNTPPNVPDSSGIAEPQATRIRYKIVGNPAQDEWQKKFKKFVEGTKGTWDQVNVEINLEDDRQRTVRVDTEKEASEVLFVRSELVIIPDDLKSCTTDIVPSVVKAAKSVLAKK